MKENLNRLKERASSFWTNRSKVQKITIIGSALVVFLLIGSIAWFSNNSKFVPLYQNLSQQEAGQIKEELEEAGIDYELNNGGTTVLVPEDEAENLLVDFASQGLPNSGNIDYSFFSENSSFGITDNEFDMMKLDATQTELSNLIKRIDGIEDAKVMINMPKEPLFVSEDLEEASASIVIHTQPGFQFQGNQIDSLYHLVSKAIPNLPEENVVIMNQHFEYFDQNNSYANNDFTDYTSQQAVKKEIEKDIQRRLQQMIGAMVGHDKAIVSVTADVDFTQENRQEELIEPVDLENMEGVPISIETIHETYSGTNVEGGVAGTGEEDIPGYQAVADDGDGEYELIKEMINNEFNHIRRDIVESPYKIRDLGIQVAVDSAVQVDGNETQLLNQQEQNEVEEGISSILDSMIRTSIDKDYGDIETNDKISIVFQEFSETQEPTTDPLTGLPTWIYIALGILLLAIIILVIMLLRNRKSEEYEEEFIYEDVLDEDEMIPALETEETESQVRIKQLENMAQEQPEEFAKLLRSWITED